MAIFGHFKIISKKSITDFTSSLKSDESLWKNSDNSVFATGCN